MTFIAMSKFSRLKLVSVAGQCKNSFLMMRRINMHMRRSSRMHMGTQSVSWPGLSFVGVMCTSTVDTE